VSFLVIFALSTKFEILCPSVSEYILDRCCRLHGNDEDMSESALDSALVL